MKSKWVLRTSVLLVMVLLLSAAAVLPALAGLELGFDVRFTGVIAKVGSATEAWVIGGQTLATDANTQVILTVSPAQAGQWAEVAAKRQADGSLLAKQITVRPEQVRLRGIVTSIPEGNVGDWVIAGVTVKVTADTKLGTRGGTIEIGKWVEAVMTEDAGVLTAKQIMAIGAQDAVEVNGAIQSFSETEWVLSGIKLAVNPADPNKTLISGKPAVDLIARAAAELQDDGTLVAKVIRVAWIDRNDILPMADFTGVIEKLPAVGLRGEWTVDGKSVVVMPNTRIHQEKGLAVVGATVHVLGWQALDKVIATDITVIESPQEGGTYILTAGVIEALPASGVKGMWTVSGQQVLVNDDTEVQGTTPAVGKIARVEGVRRASDNVIVASIVRVRDAVIPPTYMPTGTVTPPVRPTRTPRP